MLIPGSIIEKTQYAAGYCLSIPVDGELHPEAHRVVFQTVQVFHLLLVARKLDVTNVLFDLFSSQDQLRNANMSSNSCSCLALFSLYTLQQIC